MSYIDWSQHLDYIEDKHAKTILELGCGKGTGVLLEEFGMVYSFEISENDEWFNETKKNFSKYNNWHPYFKTLDEIGYTQKVKEKFLEKGTMNPNCSKNYMQWIEDTIDTSELDVVFVDHGGGFFRPDSVNYFLQKKVPYVFYHDSQHGAYNWNRIEVPDIYMERAFPQGEGTVFLKLRNL